MHIKKHNLLIYQNKLNKNYDSRENQEEKVSCFTGYTFGFGRRIEPVIIAIAAKKSGKTRHTIKIL